MSSPSPPARRFAPQPVETTKSSRKFKPEMVETTTKSNRGASGGDSRNTTTSPPRRRFVPEPVETTKSSSRQRQTRSRDEQSPPDRKTPPKSKSAEATPKPRPRFTPQLIETTRRSRKANSTGPTLAPTDKTDISPGDHIHLPREQRLASPSLLEIATTNSPILRGEKAPLTAELRRPRSGSSRQHSWVAPTLDSIESSDSDQSSPPSLSTSPSSPQENSLDAYKHATRIRESCDDRFSGYLLALAAAAAEKQMREQAMAMAAYPNEESHEPVDHFAVDRESDEEDELMGVGLLPHEGSTSRRESDVGMEMAEMRRYQEKLEEQRKENERERDQTMADVQASASMASGPFGDASKVGGPTDASGAPKTIIGGWQKGVGLGPMRSAASPPMLGGDLVFPKCQSPQSTMIETDQRPRITITRENSKSDEDPNKPKIGLWMGYCGPTKSEFAVRNYQSGLMTPRPEPAVSITTPDKDSEGDTYMSGAPQSIDELLAFQEQVEKEFTDDFVTQVFNYLSLGYPALARKFDAELSKISRIPQEDLRKDDRKHEVEGFVGLSPEPTFDQSKGDFQDQSKVTRTKKLEKSSRWQALKIYIHEWARQQPRMRDGNPGWAVSLRRGSWAF